MPGLTKKDFDAVVVGAGPNGLAAAITLQQQGLSVLLVEGKDTIGGGARSAEITLPGFTHDICSAVHPLAAGSPFFKALPLSAYGLEYIYPEISAAHPFDNGQAAALMNAIEDTGATLADDKAVYQDLLRPLVNGWPDIVADVLAPLHFPKDARKFMDFGLRAITSAKHLSKKFGGQKGRGFLAGMAAHSMQPLSNIATSAVALVLLIAGHTSGWPIIKGGTGRLSAALANFFVSIGGTIETNFFVTTLSDLPSAHAVLFDVTPRQLLRIAGDKLSPLYQWQLQRYRYGMGVFKIDWALDGPAPFTADSCRRAGTVHLGNTFEEIADAERATWSGTHPERPFVLFSQPGVCDPSRAPQGKHTAWAYCHVPKGSCEDMTGRIEKQVERFAPGFRDRILARHVMTAAEMERYNPNYIGGDINGGVSDITQIFTRPALRISPYRTSAKGIYICSSSTPPGGGVHGMCGYHAARQALKDIFVRKCKI